MRIPSTSTGWRRGLVAVAAVGISLFAAGPALADDAFTTGSVNMRTGPGTNYAKIGTLPRGTGVDVLGCTSGWCQVSAGGAPGWVSDNYLAGFVGPPPVYRGPPPPVYVTPPPIYVEPPPYYGPGYYGPGYRPPPPYYDRPGYRPPPPYYGDRPPGYRPPPGGWDNNNRPPPGYRPPPGQGGGGQGGGWQGGNRPPQQGNGGPPQPYQPPQQGGQRPPPQQGGQQPPQGGQVQPPPQQGQPGKPQFFVPGQGVAPPCAPGTMFCSPQ